MYIIRITLNVFTNNIAGILKFIQQMSSDKFARLYNKCIIHFARTFKSVSFVAEPWLIGDGFRPSEKQKQFLQRKSRIDPMNKMYARILELNYAIRFYFHDLCFSSTIYQDYGANISSNWFIQTDFAYSWQEFHSHLRT